MWTQNKRVPPLVPSRETQSSSVNTDIALKQEKKNRQKNKTTITPVSFFFFLLTFIVEHSSSTRVKVKCVSCISWDFWGWAFQFFRFYIEGEREKICNLNSPFWFFEFFKCRFKKRSSDLSHSSVNWMWQISLSLLNLEKSRPVRRFTRGKLKHIRQLQLVDLIILHPSFCALRQQPRQMSFKK